MVKFFISITTTFLTAATILTSNTLAGPFGLEMGMNKSTFSNLEQTKTPELFKTYDVPIKHSDFEYYLLYIDNKYGLCKVIAVGKDISHDKTGSKIKSKFEGFQKALNNKYGISTNFNFIRNGALWDDYDEFMMSLTQEERYLSSFWPEEDSNRRLKENIKMISLSANGLSSHKGYINLGYEFENFEQCKADDEKRNISAL